MATEKEVFDMARQGVMQAAAPLVGSMNDRAAFQAAEIKRRQDLLDEQRERDQARADWIERFNTQTNAAKAAAKELRDFNTSEREARQSFQAGESDWQFFRAREVQLQDRGYDTEQAEKEIRLKAVQFGMPNAMKASIEDVYKHIYRTAPEELEKIKRNQSDAFKKINPEAYAAYEQALEERANILTEMNNLITSHAGGPTEERVVEALLRRLGPRWSLTPEIVARIKAGGIPEITRFLADHEDLRPEFDLALEKVTEELTAREDQVYRDQLGRLLKLEKISQETINRVRQMDPSIFPSNKDENKELTTKVRNNQGAEALSGGSNNTSVSNNYRALPPTDANIRNITGGTNATPAVVTTPVGGTNATPAVVTPPVNTDSNSEDEEGDPSVVFNPANAAGALRPTGGSRYKFSPWEDLPKTSKELYEKKDEMEGNLRRQDTLIGKMLDNKSGDLGKMKALVERNQKRLKDIDDAIFQLENPKQPTPKASPMRPSDYVNEQSVLMGMGYPNPNRPLTLTEKLYKDIDPNWVDPRTIGPVESRLRGKIERRLRN